MLPAFLARIRSPSNRLGPLFARPVTAEQICTVCGYAGAPVLQKKGRDDIEVVLWVLCAGFAALYVLSRGVGLLDVYMPGVVVHLLSRLTEIFLGLSLVYTVWQLTAEFEACPKCQRASMIPLDSPKGQKVRAEQQP